MKEDNIEDKKRLNALKSYELMGFEEETLYDDITALAAAICNTPISLISLVDDKRQFFKSHHGLDITQTPLEESFCIYLITDNLNSLIVENAHEDDRFANYTSVTDSPNIGFYAGVPLTTPEGYCIGSLCVMDHQSKKLSNHQLKGLKTLSKQVIQLFELKKSRKNEEIQKNELEQKGSLLNNIVAATEIGIWERNIPDNSMTLNKEGLKMIGYSTHQTGPLSYTIWENLIHPSDLSKVQERLNSCFNDKTESFDIQYRIMNKEGRITWIHDIGKILYWNNHKPLLMYGTIQDVTEKVTSNFELIKLKNNQEAIINNTNDIMWSIDTEFRLIIGNTSYHELVKGNIGYSFKEGDIALSDKIDDDTNHKWKTYYTRALNGEQFSIKEKFYNPANLAITYGLTTFNPLYDNNGKLLGVTCFSKDITSEVLSQQVLLAAKEEMQRIMDASLDIICTIDEDGYFLSLNKACKKIWGYKPQELIGQYCLDFIHPEDKPATLAAAKAILVGKKIPNFENRYLHKNGSIIPMLWSSKYDSNDRVIYGIARDNTIKKKAEQQLETSERRFKTLVQDGSDLIAILDHEANFFYVSPTSKSILERTPEELIGTNAFDYVHPEDYEKVYSQFIKVLGVPQTTIKPFRFKKSAHEWIWMETIVTNKLDEPSINGIVVNSRDITKRVEYVKAIEEQNKKLKEIAWTQSHIVRAPVARLMGLINLILDENESLSSEENKRMLRYILQSANEIDAVIRQIVNSTTETLDAIKIE